MNESTAANSLPQEDPLTTTIKGLFRRVERSEATIKDVAEKSSASAARLERSIASLESTMQHFGQTIDRVNNRSTPWAVIISAAMVIITIFTLSLSPTRWMGMQNYEINQEQTRVDSLFAREIGTMDSRLSANEDNVNELRQAVDRIRATRVEPEDVDRLHDLLTDRRDHLEERLYREIDKLRGETK